MKTETFLLYLVTWTLVALSPGPAVLFSMAASVRSGLRPSLAGIAGIQLGNAIFFVCSGLGLGALLSSARIGFAILRGAGAIYLIYLGSRIILSTLRRGEKPLSQSTDVGEKRAGPFLRGLLIQITNPKALLFVSALLPQFLDPNKALGAQLVILGVTTVLVDTAVLTGYARLASHGARVYRDSRVAAILERLFGGALILFGVRLLRARQ